MQRSSRWANNYIETELLSSNQRVKFLGSFETDRQQKGSRAHQYHFSLPGGNGVVILTLRGLPMVIRNVG